MSIEVNSSLRQSHAALPIAGERNHGRHGGQDGAVPRIERHGPLRSLAKRGEIATKEVHIRELFPAHLAGASRKQVLKPVSVPSLVRVILEFAWIDA